MKNASQYAARMRKVLGPLARSAGDSAPDAHEDPLHHLAVGILAQHDGRAAGEKALERIFRKVLDWNELRVSTPDELVALVGGVVRRPLEMCKDLCDALNAVFRRENTMSLRRLADGRVKDARRYLETLMGMNAYATASVLLFGLGAHAVPVSDRLLDALRRRALVDPNATREEAQAFLERHVKAGELRSYCLALDALEAQRIERGAAGVADDGASRARKPSGGGGGKKAATGSDTHSSKSMTRSSASPSNAGKHGPGSASRRPSSVTRGKVAAKPKARSRPSSKSAHRKTGK